MKLNILATTLLALPLCIGTPVKAENSRNFSQVRTVQPSVPVTQANWSEFSSRQGGFAVSMPGTPEEKTETDSDGSVDRSFTLTQGKTAYYVHYTDIPDVEKLNSDELKQLLDGMPAVFVQGAEGKLVTERNVVINNYPGKEFEFTLNDGTIGRARVYMVKQRLFVIVGTSTEPENAQKFIESFRLL